jgi:hypothetical protein
LLKLLDVHIAALLANAAMFEPQYAAFERRSKSWIVFENADMKFDAQNAVLLADSAMSISNGTFEISAMLLDDHVAIFDEYSQHPGS